MTAMWLFSLAVLFAMADWYAVEKNVFWLRYLAKPLVIVALGIWLLCQPLDFAVLFWFFLALVFSLIGDIWLLAPPRFFMLGLASFLLAHVCYIIGINNENLPPLTWPVIRLVSFFVFMGVFIYPLLFRGIKQRSGTRKLQGATLIYYIVLSLMAISATTTLYRPDWEYQTVVFVSAGGLLFFFSDFLLAFDRFIRPVNHGRMVVHISYHLGQFGLILGVVWHLLINSYAG
jgi:alkenylglycerophosphocholine/alkenylglycerophosphoethanolamine hydrolase